MIPSVGRVVHFQTHEGALVPAIIADVKNADTGECDLVVFDHTKKAVVFTSGDRARNPPEPGRWHQPAVPVVAPPAVQQVVAEAPAQAVAE